MESLNEGTQGPAEKHRAVAAEGDKENEVDEEDENKKNEVG